MRHDRAQSQKRSRQEQGDRETLMTANEIVLQNLDKGLLTITMNRPDRRNALNPDMTRGLVEAARRAAEDHEVRAVLSRAPAAPSVSAATSSRWRRAARRCRSKRSRSRCAGHGSVADPAPDEQARGGAARRRGSRRRAVDRAVLRSQGRLRILQDHHGFRQGRLLRRLWRHLFPDQDARDREGPRALSDVAGADRQGSARTEHGDEGGARCRV